MKTALIAGATGLVGSALLKLLIRDVSYSKIIVLVRRPLNFEHSKVEQVIYDYENPIQNLIKADLVFCCLGTTIKKAGSQSGFRKVDYEYPLQLGRYALANGVTTFAIITSAGADDKSSVFYSRVKGEVESELRKLNFESLLIFRPSLLLGSRDEFRVSEEWAKKIMNFLGFLIPKSYRGIHASKVAAAMAYFGLKSPKGVTVVPSGQMQDFDGLTND